MAEILLMKKMKMIDADRDRISELPEPILLHILSFLDMKHVVHTSFLSKRWRYLWISLPHLSFDHNLWKDIIGEESQKDVFVNFVDKVLLQRESSNLHKFSLRDFCCNSGSIEAWIIAAVRRHVQEFNLEIFALQPIKVSSIVFISAIRTFKLKSYRKSFKIPIQLPDTMCSAAQLKTLELVSVTLPKGDSNGELILNCPILENLIVEDCDDRHLRALNISASQLKNLVLKNLTNGYWGNIKQYKIKICTPNLKSFQWENPFYRECSLENLSFLDSAYIISSFRMDPMWLIRILNWLHNVKSLTLSGWCVKTCPESTNAFTQLPNPFSNLRCLRLTNWRYNSCMSAIANILAGSRFIETLVMELETASDPKYKEGDWGARLSFSCKFYHLKSIEIHNIVGREDELELLKFLLKNAMVLENITITTIKACSKYKEKELAEFSKKLQLLPRCTTVPMLFVLKSVT